MIKIYYCTQCERVIYSNYLYKNCKICDTQLYRLPIFYEDFTTLDEEERQDYIKQFIEESKNKLKKKLKNKEQKE